MAYEERVAERVRNVLSTRTGVTEKKMMGTLAFLVDATMCCSVGGAGLLVRVAPHERDDLLALPHVTSMQLGTRTMRGFVRVAPEGYRTTASLSAWVERGVAAAASAR